MGQEVIILGDQQSCSTHNLWGLLSCGLYLQGNKEVTVGLYKNLRGLAKRKTHQIDALCSESYSGVRNHVKSQQYWRVAMFFLKQY